MKWQRGKYSNYKFHLPREGNECSQYWHYFQTLCRNEIKAFYSNWEIAEDPDEKECCQKCLAILKKRELK
jgi:hypothetical protein